MSILIFPSLFPKYYSIITMYSALMWMTHHMSFKGDTAPRRSAQAMFKHYASLQMEATDFIVLWIPRIQSPSGPKKPILSPLP